MPSPENPLTERKVGSAESIRKKGWPLGRIAAASAAVVTVGGGALLAPRLLDSDSDTVGTNTEADAPAPDTGGGVEVDIELEPDPDQLAEEDLVEEETQEQLLDPAIEDQVEDIFQTAHNIIDASQDTDQPQQWTYEDGKFSVDIQHGVTGGNTLIMSRESIEGSGDGRQWVNYELSSRIDRDGQTEWSLTTTSGNYDTGETEEPDTIAISDAAQLNGFVAALNNGAAVLGAEAGAEPAEQAIDNSETTEADQAPSEDEQTVETSPEVVDQEIEEEIEKIFRTANNLLNTLEQMGGPPAWANEQGYFSLAVNENGGRDNSITIHHNHDGGVDTYLLHWSSTEEKWVLTVTSGPLLGSQGEKSTAQYAIGGVEDLEDVGEMLRYVADRDPNMSDDVVRPGD